MLMLWQLRDQRWTQQFELTLKLRDTCVILLHLAVCGHLDSDTTPEQNPTPLMHDNVGAQTLIVEKRGVLAQLESNSPTHGPREIVKLALRLLTGCFAAQSPALQALTLPSSASTHRRDAP